jgi:hypothetical protein
LEKGITHVCHENSAVLGPYVWIFEQLIQQQPTEG